MEKSRKGGFIKDGDYIEVRLSKGATYEEMTAAAARSLELSLESTDFEGEPELTLFRTDGTIVPNQPISLDDPARSVPWTLERYLKSVKKSAAQLKLGIGYRYKVMGTSALLASGNLA